MRLLILGLVAATAAATPSMTPSWTATSNFSWSGNTFAVAVSSAGDVNGDGIDDLIIGAPGVTAGPEGGDIIGAALVYHGSPAGLPTSHSWIARGWKNSQFGSAVACAGDVNGDGYDDVIVGAYNFDPPGAVNAGRACVYHGSAAGLPDQPSWTADGDQEGSHLGIAVSSAGDVNGDGFDDVIVGAHYYDQAAVDEGQACVYLGSADGLGTAPAWVAYGSQASSTFGRSVSNAGDVDGDGFDDVLVGAYAFDTPEHAGAGAACLYRGGRGGLSPTPAWTVTGGQIDECLGVSVAGAGDINGDGYDDVLIGADGHDGGATDEGAAFAYFGGASGLASIPSWSAQGNQKDAYFGAAVAAAGDLNGDGFDDIMVGAHGFDFDATQKNTGRVVAYAGGPGGPSAAPFWTVDGTWAYSVFGSSLARAGDVNGDGLQDLVIGDYKHRVTGAAFVHHGQGIACVAPGQFTPGGSAIAPGGATISTSVEVRARVADSSGGDLILEVEAVSAGGETLVATSAPVPSGVEATALLAPLTRGQVYRWRARARAVSSSSVSDWREFGHAGMPQETDFYVRYVTAARSSAIVQVDPDGGRAVPIGGTPFFDRIGFEATIDDDDGDRGMLQVEIRPAGGVFQDIATHESGPVASGGMAAILAPLPPGPYCWQHRTMDETGMPGPWMSYGGNADGEADFVILGGSIGSGGPCQHGATPALSPPFALAGLGAAILILGRALRP